MGRAGLRIWEVEKRARFWHYSAKREHKTWKYQEVSISLTRRSFGESVRVWAKESQRQSAQGENGQETSCENEGIRKWNERRGEMKGEVKHRCGTERWTMMEWLGFHHIIRLSLFFHMRCRKRALPRNEGKRINFGLKGTLVLIITLLSTAYWTKDKHLQIIYPGPYYWCVRNN